VKARVTVTADVNILALNRMLTENGQWLVTVHNRRIVKMARVPEPVPIGNGAGSGSGTGSADGGDGPVCLGEKSSGSG